MVPIGLMLLTFAAPPAVAPPAFATGDEVVYVGDVWEVSERPELPYRRRSTLEIRLFVLAASRDGTDIAVLTLVRPVEDAAVAEAVKIVTGTAPDRAGSPAVRLDIVRVDARGRVKLLLPAAGPPLTLAASTPAGPVPGPPADGPPAVELGMFVPFPEALPAVGDTWTTPETPAATWTAKQPAVWAGAVVTELAGTRETPEWRNTPTGRRSWHRTDAVWMSPADGLARVVRRKTEHKTGPVRAGWVEVQYEMRPPVPHRGESYNAVRREIELAYSHAVRTEPLLADAVALGPKPFMAVIAKLDAHARDALPTPFRDAIDGVRRRCEAAARGETPAAAQVAIATVPVVGKPAPDFAAPGFWLAEHAGKPRLLVFFKPDSETSAATLKLSAALHKRFPGLRVVPLGVFATPAAATAQRDALKLDLPVFPGETARVAYAVETFPRFVLIDAAGILAWDFDGIGPEVGFLAKAEIEKLTKPGR